MKPWLRRLHLILAIGGGFTGAILTLQSFFTSKEANPLLYAMYVCFFGLYAYGIWAGVRFAEREEDQKPLVTFYWLQVPWLSSPLIGYRFASGFHVSGAVIGDKMTGFFRVGSDWQFELFQPVPWGLGLNFFALAMALLLMKKKPVSSGVSNPVTTPPSP